MQFLSNSGSTENRIPTWLAIIESVAAMAFALVIAIKFNTLLLIAIGSCIAPVLLMRSPQSIELGKRWFEIGLPEQTSESKFKLGILYLRVLIWSVFVRVFATLRHPIVGIKNIPDNWSRVVLCTDIRTPMELVPGTGTVREVLQGITEDEEWANPFFLIFVIAFYAAIFFTIAVFVLPSLNDGILKFVIISILLILFLSSLLALHVFVSFLTCFVSAYFFRFSMKSTAILWLPLLFILRSRQNPKIFG